MQNTQSLLVSKPFNRFNWNLKPRFLVWWRIVWIKISNWEIGPGTFNTYVDVGIGCQKILVDTDTRSLQKNIYRHSDSHHHQYTLKRICNKNQCKIMLTYSKLGCKKKKNLLKYTMRNHPANTKFVKTFWGTFWERLKRFKTF